MSKKLLFNLNKNVSQDYTYVKYTGTIVTATNTLEKPIKNAILKGCTYYRDTDTNEILETFEEGRNLELISVKMPILKTTTNNFFNAKDGDLIIGRMSSQGVSIVDNKYGVILQENLFFDAIPNKYCWFFPSSTHNSNGNLYFYDKDYNFIKKVGQYDLVPENARYMKFSYEIGIFATQDDIDLLLREARIGYFESWRPTPTYNDIPTHKSNILHTPEEMVLKGLGDVQDTLNINTGEMIERIGIAKLSQIPDEDFGDFAPYGVNSILTKTANINIRKTKFNKYFLPYRANPKAISNFALCYYTTYNKDFECFALHSDDVQSVQISLSHSRFNDELTKEKMIQLIKELDITLVYELATPTIKTVDLSILDQDGNVVSSVSSFNNTTYITTSSETISPIFEGYIATKESVE